MSGPGPSRQVLADLTRMAMSDMLRARRRWDEPPGLHFMYREDCCGIRVSARSLVPSLVWASGPPPHVLADLARGMCDPGYRETLVALAPETFFGVAFRCEAWMVVTPAGDELAVRRAETAARRRTLSRHPGRVEQRSVWAMTRLGLFSAFQVRGRDDVDTRRCHDMEGTIPDALVSMYRAVVSETAPLPAGFGGRRSDASATHSRPPPR